MMIIDEITDILNDSKNLKILGDRLNSLYDEFRDGRDPNDIVKLLTNSNEKLVWQGCNICCEIIVNNSHYSNILINELLNILENNESSRNRERAFDALYGFYMDIKDIEGFKKNCERYKNDSNIEISFSCNNFFLQERTK